MPDPSADPVPFFDVTFTITLPDTATDEQRDLFFRELKAAGGSPTLTLRYDIDPSIPQEERQKECEKILAGIQRAFSGEH